MTSCDTYEMMGVHELVGLQPFIKRHTLDMSFNTIMFDTSVANYAQLNHGGFDRNNIHTLTGTKYNVKGYDVTGFDARGFNKKGYNEAGYNKCGYDKNGYNYEGYDINGYNADGLYEHDYDEDFVDIDF